MASVNDALREARIGLELMIQADETGQSEEFKAQALHLAEHFESLDNALRNGGNLPTEWQILAAAARHNDDG